jgi:hypothetical protein
MSKGKAQALGPEHYRAICDEIGARLAQVLRPTTLAPSPRIAELLDKLACLDHDAPSIAPSVEEMEPLEEMSIVRRADA